MITAATMRAHRGRWHVWAGSEIIRYQATMRGQWGYDVECSCGEWRSNTGGGLRRYVAQQLEDHRYDAQQAAAR